LFHFELWRPFTSLFIATSPLEVIFGALIIYSIGGMLETRWSRKRFLAVGLGIPLIAEIIILTATLFLGDPLAYQVFTGSRQVVTTLWIIFGLVAHFSHEILYFWGTPVTGKTFALIGVGFVALSGVFGSFLPLATEVVTVALCYLYMYRHRIFRLRNQLELRYYDWKLSRLKSKTKLHVIEGKRKTSSSLDRDDDEDEPGPQIH
jgi:membrane associated rhomboid family serine protease